MTVYMERRTLVEAQVWQPGTSLPGVTEARPELVHALGGQHYYATYADCWPKAWLGIQPLDAVPEDADALRSFWRPPGVKDIFYEVLPFQFWSLKSGPRQPCDENDPLFCRYAEHAGWPRREAIGRIRSGSTISFVYPGDWVVRYPDDSLRVYSDDEFGKRYEPVEAVT